MTTSRSGRVAAAFAVLAICATLVGGAVAQVDDDDPEGLCAPGRAGVVYGTPGSDHLNGTDGDDVICGLGGADTISARGGNDIVDGGAGSDNISGGPDADRLLGGGGDDMLAGAEGDDALWGESGDDQLNAAEGDDALDGGAGVDHLNAAAGDDRCAGGETTNNCEDATGTDPLAQPLTLAASPVAPPLTFTLDDGFPGLSVTIETGGGIYPWDVEVEPARLHMSGRVSELMVGPAFDLTVPESAPAIRGATLTLPYHEARLGSSPESGLRIYTYDEDAQLWVPLAGAQTVDAAANTVTARVSHFSVYAVFKARTPEQWKEIFGETPLRCVGTSADIDVVFLVDTSGSMASNDPAGLRVDGAKAFVAEMRDGDRAAVVGFDSFARTEIELTSIESGRAAIDAALERTRPPGGGTSISAAVQRAIAILSNNGGQGRLRVAILLTDGQSSYNSALTAQAANELIEVHTVGLGAGVNAALLQSIATGTGASYRQLNHPAQLPALYRELAGDIIGDDTDTDGDGLTDCVERNGLFVPTRITFPFIGGSIDFASFIMTDPNNADTDGDGLSDGFEVEARNLRANPELAAEYDFLIELGSKTYYKLIANPTDTDSDDDGLDDLLEIRNGTDPLVPNGSDLGIEGLDLPPFTLFQPDRYSERPAISQRLTVRREGNTAIIERVFYNDNPVRYDGDRDCVENCAAIEKLAQERPDGDGFRICVGPINLGNCANDESQERDIVEEARVKQGVFDGDGSLSETFLREQLALQCAIWYSDAQRCFDEAARANVPGDASADDFAAVLGVITAPLPVPRTVNPETVRRMAEALRAAAAAFGVAVLADAIAECIRGPVLEVVAQLLPFVHPCELLPLYAPGGDVGEARDHRVAALANDPTRILERWASQAERNARPFNRNWYIGRPGCTAADRAAAEARVGGAVECDEFPNWAMEKAGPGASLRYIDASDNGREGINLNLFLRACPETTNAARAQRVPFLVVATPVPQTVWHCGRR